MNIWINPAIYNSSNSEITCLLRLCLFRLKWKLGKYFTPLSVWVHMKIRSNWKSNLVDRKLNPLDPEIGLRSNFTFNQFPLSSLTHTKPKEWERERDLACATANPPPPLPLPTRHCLLSPICLYCCLHSPPQQSHCPLGIFFSLFFSLFFFFLQIIFDLGDGGSVVGMGFFRLYDEFVVGFKNGWGEFFQGVW